MRLRQIGGLVAIVLALLSVGRETAWADITFHCPDPSAEIPLGEFIYEFPSQINSNSGGDSVDVVVNAVLPDGWFWQVCQVSSGVCYFDNVRIFIGDTFDGDVLRVDFFPNTGEPGVGYLQVEIRLVDDPTDVRYCTYTVFNGTPELAANFQIDCSENTVFAESGEFIHEFFAPVTNESALDDSITIVPHTMLPDGWFSQFCQTSTGVCYFNAAKIPLAIGVQDTIRVDFFPSSDGFGKIELEMFSDNNPSIWRRCYYNVYQGDGFTTNAPEGMGSPATVASFAQPNPFAGTTAIRFQLSETTEGDLRIFTADGREVRTMPALRLAAGEAEVTWDGRDQRGAATPSGVYFYRFESGSAEAKGLLVKTR